MDAKPIPLSSAARDRISSIVAARRPPEYLTYRLMAAHAVPEAGKVESADVEALRRVLQTKYQGIEQKVNDCAMVLREPPRAGADIDAKRYRQAAQSTAMRSMQTAAEASKDVHELDYIAQMLMEHKAIIINVAKNPYLGEDTQVKIANHPIYRNDPYVARALASNQNLAPAAARSLAQHHRNDRFVMNELATTVGKLALVDHNTPEYAAICRELTTVPQVDFPLAPAIRGVKDAAHLRALWDQHKLRPTIERELDHSTYHAIAQNHHTPDDVIGQMAIRNPLTALFGKEVAMTQEVIARRLAEIAERNAPRVRHEAPRPA